MLDQLKNNWKWYTAGAVLLILVVMAFCWWLWTPAPPKPETAKPAQRQADGSLLLERRPDPNAKAKQILPPGAKLERTVSVTVQPAKATAPRTAPQGGGSFMCYSAQCPPVVVDLSLVRMPDTSRRVVASSPDGEVIGGVDIPVESAKPPPEPKLWAVGAVADPVRQAYGGFVDRDIGFARVGLQLNQRDQGSLPNQAWIKAGIRF